MTTHTAGAVEGPTIDTTRWRIDPARSTIEFHAKSFWGMTTVTGRFRRYHGTLDLTARPAIELTIEADSLDTAHEKRDAHLRSADFFDAEDHPYVRFVSESAALRGDELHVRGRLRARGSSVPLELQATLRRAGDELELKATTHVDRRQLGMTWNMLRMVRASSKLTVTGRLVRDAG